MIRDLRKKFILVAMLSTLVVLTAIMGVVNISNYMDVLERADEMTDLLAQNDGNFQDDSKDTEPPVKPEGTSKLPQRNRREMKKIISLRRHRSRRVILL